MWSEIVAPDFLFMLVAGEMLCLDYDKNPPAFQFSFYTGIKTNEVLHSLRILDVSHRPVPWACFTS